MFIPLHFLCRWSTALKDIFQRLIWINRLTSLWRLLCFYSRWSCPSRIDIKPKIMLRIMTCYEVLIQLDHRVCRMWIHIFCRTCMRNRHLISFSSNSKARFVFYPIIFSKFPRTILLKVSRYDSLRFRYEFRSLRVLCDCNLAVIYFLI